MDAGSVVVGIQIGGLTTFVSGWAGAAAAVGKAVASMGAEIAKHVQEVVKVNDELGRLNAQTGLSVEFLSKLQYAATMTDAKFEGVAHAIQVAVREGKILGGEEGLGQVFARLQAIKDPAERAAEAFAVFGRQSNEVLPLLTGNMAALSREAERLGVVFDSQRSQLFGVLGDEMDRAGEAVRGLWTEISEQVAPRLTQLFSIIANGLPAITAWIDNNDTIKRTLDAIGATLVNLWDSYWQFERNAISVYASIGNSAIDMYTSVTKTTNRMVTYFISAIRIMVNGAAAAFKEELGTQLSLLQAMGSGAMGIMGRIFGITPEAIAKTKAALDVAVGIGKTAIGAVVDVAREGSGNAQTAIGVVVSALDKLSGVDVQNESAEKWAAGMRLKLKGVADDLTDVTYKIQNVSQSFSTSVGGLAGDAGGLDVDLDGRVGGEPGGVDNASKREQDVADKRLGIINNFARQAGGVWQAYMKQGKGAFDALGKAFMETAASMAMSEGMYHFLAGLAMSFTPGLQEQGARRMTNGALLIALGATLGALGGAGASAGGGAGGGGTGGVDYSTTPGTDVDQPDKRRQLTVVVNGNMFNSRETWSHLAELSAEFSDSDIKFAQGSVATA